MHATPRLHPLTVGEPAPWFSCRTRMRERYTFDSVAGHYIALSFLGAGWTTDAEALLQGIWSVRERFDDFQVSFFGVRNNPPEPDQGLLQDSIPGIRFFWDPDRSVSEL